MESLSPSQIRDINSLYNKIYEPKEEEREIMTEETFKECLETVILEAIDQSGLLDIEFEDEELQIRLIEEVLSENFLKNQIKKVVTSKTGKETLKKLGGDVLKTTGIGAGVAGAVDTLNQDAVSGKRNMALRTTLSTLKNLPSSIRAAYTTVQSGGKDTGNKVIDITGTGLTQNKDIRKTTDDTGRVVTTTKELQKDRKEILDKIRTQRNKDK